eukprot:s776_g8.t1
MPGLPTNVFAMVFLCLVGSHAVSHDASCGDCMEHNEENVLVQLANLQPDLGSNSAPGFRRFRRLRRRFRGFGRYGGKTTPAPAESTTRAPGGTTGASPTTTRATTTEASPASTTTTASTTSTTSTASTTTTASTTSTTSTASTGTIASTVTTNPVQTTESTSARATSTEATASTTTTTRVVCTGNTLVRLTLDANPAQSEFTLESPVGPPECQCVGGRTFPLARPGWLEVGVFGVGDPKNVSFISITSPNATEVVLTPFISVTGTLDAGTVLFNGFQGGGNWTVKLLDASGTLSSETGTFVLLEFASIACSQISPTPDCVGNDFGGRSYIAQNFSLVGTTLSMSPSLLQFDVDVSSSCCVPALRLDDIFLGLGFTAAPTGTEVRAEGLSPSGIPFNLTGDINFNKEVFPQLTPGFVGSPAAGLWNLSAIMESGSAVIDDASFPPRLQLRVEPC